MTLPSASTMHTAQPPHTPTLSRTDLLIVGALLIAGLKFTLGLEAVLDIGLYDESNYLSAGTTLTSVGLPSAEQAPLYATWYYILSLLEPNRITLYFLNYKLMTILPPLFLYLVLRSNRVATPVSVVLSWSLLLSPGNVSTWPKVCHFALIVALLFLLFVGHMGSPFRAGLAGSIGALLVSYIRPEFFVAYLVSLVVVIIAALVQGYNRRKMLDLGGLTIYALMSTFLLLGLRSPVSGHRGFLAFGQHFAGHWAEWKGIKMHYWTHWNEIVAENFGSADSVWGAFTRNPSVFVKHITYNLLALTRNFPRQFLTFCSPFPYFAFPLFMDRVSRGVAAVALVGLVVPHITRIRERARREFREHRSVLLCFGLYLLPPVLSVVVIHPRAHYLLLVYVLAVGCVAILAGGQVVNGQQCACKHALLVGLLLIALTPYSAYQVKGTRANLETIHTIQALNITDRVNLLEAEGGFDVYLGGNYHGVAEYEKDTDFERFVRAKQINMIVVSEGLLEDTRFSEDAAWQGFLAKSQTFGFVRLKVPGTERELFVRSDLLHG